MNTSEELMENTYEHIQKICPTPIKDFLGDRLRTTIYSVCSDESRLNPKGVKTMMEQYFEVSSYCTKEERALLFNIEVIVKSAVVYYLSNLPEYIIEKLTTTEELLQEYPSFITEEVGPVELEYLLTYRNMMAIALEIIPAKRNKKLLHAICFTLEGSGKTYPTGGTQSNATSRRVLIYEQESNKFATQRRRTSLKEKIEEEEKIKRMTTCQCGSIILIRTMWKHRRSKKHQNYLLQQSSNSTIDEQIS